jgi:hypothetical protein
MTGDTQPKPEEQVVEEIKAKQRNTLWPDALLNSRSVDTYLWKGSPDAPLVQRVGAGIFGITFMLLGAGLIEVDREITPDRKSIAAVILGVIFFGVGLKVFLNGFRRRKKKAENSR